MDRNFLKQSIRRELDYYKDGLFNEDEDEYWEHVRESLEAPRKNEEPYLEEGTLFLDDEIEELEKKYGCSIEELYEGDLEEIVLEKEGIVPESARYDPQFDCIVFKYYEEAC